MSLMDSDGYSYSLLTLCLTHGIGDPIQLPLPHYSSVGLFISVWATLKAKANNEHAFECLAVHGNTPN